MIGVLVAQRFYAQSKRTEGKLACIELGHLWVVEFQYLVSNKQSDMGIDFVLILHHSK